MAHVPRLYVPTARRPGPLALDRDQAKRLASVMRLRTGDEFLVFGGDGHEWRALVEEAGKTLRTRIVELERQQPAPPLSVEVLAGVVRANRMDWLVEKCTEAGADVIRPLLCANNQRGEASSRQDRWERIAIEAAEQCGRLRVPVIASATAVERLAIPGGGAVVFGAVDGIPWPEAARLVPTTGTVRIAVGPEGGFTPDEERQLRSGGGLGVRFGPNILRTETAAIAGVLLARSLPAI